MPEKVLVINSRDKILGTNTNFTVQFQDSISQEILRILIKDVFVPNQFYNIDSSNNYIEYKQGIGLVNFNDTITPGQYNIDQLILALETKINAQLTGGAVTTITKNELTNQLIFTTAGAAPVNNNLQFIDTSTIKEVLGFNETTVSSDVNTMPYAWNFNPLQYVNIHSQQLASDHGMDAGSNTTIALLETVSLVETPFGGVAHRQNNDDELAEIIYDDQRTLNQISIKVRNSDGRLLELPENHHITIIVKAYF